MTINKIIVIDYSKADTVVNLITCTSRTWRVSKAHMHISDLIAGVYPEYKRAYTLTDAELRSIVTRLMGIHALVLRFFVDNKERTYDDYAIEGMIKNTILAQQVN